MLINKLHEQMKGHFLKAIELDPSFSKAHYQLALVYNKDGNDDSAENHLIKSTKLDLTKIEQNDILINKYLEKFQFQNAKFLLNENQNIKVDCSFSYYLLACIYLNQTKILQAKENLIKSIDFYSGFSKSHRDLGKLFLKENEIDLAKKHLDLSLDLNYGDYKTQYYFGLAMKEEADYNQAEIFFSTSLDMNLNFPPCLIEMATLKLLLNENKEAKMYYMKAKQFSKSAYHEKLEQLINNDK